MTLVVIALLHGRTEEEWYKWVKGRVERGYGYETPSEFLELYSQDRREAFKRKKTHEELPRKKEKEEV
jgi:protein phosphatase PTC2/3